VALRAQMEVGRPNQTLFLLSQDAPMGSPGKPRNYDWPVPKGRRNPAHLRAFSQTTPLLLLGKSTIYGAPGQAPVYDWPVPRGRRPTNRGFVSNNIVPLFIPPAPSAALTWPASLPQQLDQDGYQETEGKGVVRSQIEGQHTQARPRSTAVPGPLNGNLTMTGAQVSVLDSFYCNDCALGSRRFQWIDQTTGMTAMFRFTASPEFTTVGPDLYVAALKLEVMP